MLKIYFKPSFVRQYKKLPKSLQEEVKERITLFQREPVHPFLKVHKLKGVLAGTLSFSVNYSYRIVFQYISEKEVRLIAVGNHDIYN